MGKAFNNPLNELKDFQEMNERLLENKGPIQVSGSLDSQKVHLMYELRKDIPFKLIVTYDNLRAKEIYEDFLYYNSNTWLYPAKDLLFYSADLHGNLLTKSRIEVLKHLIEDEDGVVITTIDGCMDFLMPLEKWKERVISIEVSQTLDVEWFKQNLMELGYERTGMVEVTGQFSIRGGIIDVFPLTEDNPIRIELWDDEVDSIRTFELNSQRSMEQLDRVSIYPATEMILDEEARRGGMEVLKDELEEFEKNLKKQSKLPQAARILDTVNQMLSSLEFGGEIAGLDSFIQYFYKDTVTFLNYFPKEQSLFFLDEPARLTEKGEAVELEFRESMMHRLEGGYLLPGQTSLLHSVKEIQARLLTNQSVVVTGLDQKAPGIKVEQKYSMTVKNTSSYQSSFDVLIKDLTSWKREGYRVVLLSPSRTRAERLAGDLREYNLRAFYSEDGSRGCIPGEILVCHGNIHRGFEYPLLKFVVITEGDMFGKEKKKKKKKSTYQGRKLQSFSELSIGDYVVHENHGLGVYKGIEKVEVDRNVKDYIKIEYGDGGKLYVPATQLEAIQKYASSDAQKPKLNKLGGPEWKNTKKKVTSAVKNIARELVDLYATRQRVEGYQYNDDTIWQREFEELFPYEETEDQLDAIESVKEDMESQKVMDRLICGDVGYGKTEIAIRAAFKAVQENKQVVYLVPTTILAQQHYNTFSQRMKDFPIRVDLLSRFRTPAEQKRTIADLKKGHVDIVIGTHRLLSKDIAFKDLGLLIIDEEQRFGVTHKEKIKQLKQNIDVLTLTATPIPRTLHMSLIGIRDMSVLEEPPVDRLPIQTYVMEFNDEVIREAINRELSRNGQVYYVYNRVSDIDEVTNHIASLVPSANVVFAHGQMGERQLEKIMLDFISGEIDVLVTTTIIETGLDISNANTMVIHNADHFGLSQLYQLRGRVGRSNRTSYAFLMYQRNKLLRETSEKRLQAIREFTELGSGIKIAMRDLEIRGAGNILGGEQHGHMEAVGYDLYCKMLNDAVRVLKGEIKEEQFETTVDLDINAFIPPSYIKNEYQKLDIYKRISGIESNEEFSDMQDELIDRFGDIPKPVENLLKAVFIKTLAHSASVLTVSANKQECKFVMYEKTQLKVERIPQLIEKYNEKLKFYIAEPPYFTYQEKKPISDSDTILEIVKILLNDIKWLMEEEKRDII